MLYGETKCEAFCYREEDFWREHKFLPENQKCKAVGS